MLLLFPQGQGEGDSCLLWAGASRSTCQINLIPEEKRDDTSGD